MYLFNSEHLRIHSKQWQSEVKRVLTHLLVQDNFLPLLDAHVPNLFFICVTQAVELPWLLLEILPRTSLLLLENILVHQAGNNFLISYRSSFSWLPC